MSGWVGSIDGNTLKGAIGCRVSRDSPGTGEKLLLLNKFLKQELLIDPSTIMRIPMIII